MACNWTPKAALRKPLPGAAELQQAINKWTGRHPDFSLKDGSPAIDKGQIIPNVADVFEGAAPDLGGLGVRRTDAALGCPAGGRDQVADESMALWISEEMRRFSVGYPPAAICCDGRELGENRGRRCAGSARLWISPFGGMADAQAR